MSTELLRDSTFPEVAPELTSLGKRLEILRIERGISKQRLARHAGTSRQQLWRVMTGKSELTSSLRDRLAGALSVDPSVLAASAGSSRSQTFGLVATVASPFGQPAAALFLFAARSPEMPFGAASGASATCGPSSARGPPARSSGASAETWVRAPRCARWLSRGRLPCPESMIQPAPVQPCRPADASVETSTRW